MAAPKSARVVPGGFPHSDCAGCTWTGLYAAALGKEWRELVPPRCPDCDGEVRSRVAGDDDIPALVRRLLADLEIASRR